MSDSEFDFSTPHRRESKPFEPPPWERDAFEELERKKAQAQEAAQDLEPTTADLVPVVSNLKGDEPAAVEIGEIAGTSQAQEADSQEDASGETQDKGTKLDEKRVLEMMASLAAEEPKIHETTWKPALFSALVVGAIGSVLVVWGIAVMVRARAAGLIGVAGALVLIGFGLGFIALAVWIAVRTLRQRGVL